MNKVNPIKDPEKIRLIQETLAQRTDKHGERIFLLFEIGIHTGLRISDLVRLRVKNVQGEWISCIEKKTQKATRIPLNATIRTIIQDRCRDMDPNDLLFPSRVHLKDGTEKPITTRCAYDDIRYIADQFNLGDRIGCHTLRKTFGYWHYKQNHDLEMLRIWFNHASQTVTLRYIGMDDEEKKKSVIGFNPGGAVYVPRGSVSHGRPVRESDELEVNFLDRTKQGKLLGERGSKTRKK